MIERLLIVNRGEIACRIIRTARSMGITALAVHSARDRNALHVRRADEAYEVGGATPAESYLNQEALLDVARRSGADAVHPGYGFLAENPDFARGVGETDGVTWVGPGPDVMATMGVKDEAKARMASAGVPVVPDYRGSNQDPEHLRERARDLGYPVLIKPLAGGGGTGMRAVESDEQFPDRLDAARREAEGAFGDDRVLIETLLERPRHIEIQVFGDRHGSAVHLFERDCSVQRRYQKVIEEAPAPGMPAELRAEMGEAAVRAVDELDYTNAGTMEFVVDVSDGLEDAPFYFMEMNTRLQVEHPVTEMVTGQDLVEWQLLVAAGEPLPVRQEELSLEGHAIEARLYAEDPATNFRPQAGTVRRFRIPDRPSVRVDAGVEDGDRIDEHYDPLMGKLIARGPNRRRALNELRSALLDTGVAGVRTNQELLRRILELEAFRNGDLDTHLIDRHSDTLIPPSYGEPDREDLILAVVYFLSGAGTNHSQGKTMDGDPWSLRDHWRMATMVDRTIQLTSGRASYSISARCGPDGYELTLADETDAVEVREDSARRISVVRDGVRLAAEVSPGDGDRITLFRNGRSIPFERHVPGREREAMAGPDRITASMPGRVVRVLVEAGEAVEQGQDVLILEAMKMEMTLKAGRAGRVAERPIEEGDQVSEGDLLISIRDPEDGDDS